jgi:4-hydroxyacetophenone monooxygenase
MSMNSNDAAIDRDALRRALKFADPMALRPVLSLLAGNPELHARLKAMKLGDTDFFLVTMPALVDQDEIAWLYGKAEEVIANHLQSGAPRPTMPTGAGLQSLFELAFGQAVPFEDVEYWREELAVDPMPRRLDLTHTPNRDVLEQFRVIVIGAGFAGVNAGIQLKDAGIPFTIIEKNPGVGGTWYQNHYPGARVDYPSRIYSYTFQADYRWQHPFPPQKEIKAYIDHIVDQYGIRDRIRFNSEVLGATWCEPEQAWEVRIRNPDGSERIEKANAVISAVGLFDRPFIPDFPGMKEFKGPVFHSTQWDDSLDLGDKHVAIVGSGATALQIAATVAKMAKQLTVFQRTPPWMTPWPGYADPVPTEVQWLFDHVPYYLNFVRVRMSYALGDRILGQVFDVDPKWRMELSVNAFNERIRQRLVAYATEKLGSRPDLLEKCLPKYPPLANRFVVDAGWFDALLNGWADLVPEAVDRISPDGIVTRSGKEVRCDVIVLATGFRANDFLWPMHIVGCGGKTIREAWAKDGGRAYLGMTVPGFPNFFMLYGPNTNPRAGTPPLMAEIQVRYILSLFAQMAERGLRSVSVRQDVYDAHNEKADEILARSIWMDQRQKSYYRNDFNRVATNSPWKTIDYWRWTRKANLGDYETR